MPKINEEYVIKRYRDKHSTYSIAKELNTYPKKIERILKKNNEPIRDRSESQKLAIESGRAKHPTKGKQRTEEERVNISEGVHKNWQNKSDTELERISEDAKKRWKDIPADKKREMLEKAGRALHKTCKEGSKAEKYIYRKIRESGREAVMHKTGLTSGNFEIDLFLPGLKTIIEIDGPQHFLPLFGQKRLEETIKLDSRKNGLLLSDGYCVIRIKYMLKTFSQKSARDLWGLISEHLDKIDNKFPGKEKRFIELEIK